MRLARAVLMFSFLFVPAAQGAVSTSSWFPKGGQAGAAFGSSVAPAGDINDDGYPDVLVGAPLYDNGQADEGRVYLYLGGPSGLSMIPSWTWEPDQAGAQAGAAVAGAGDTNADGYGDVLIGAPLFDRPGHADAGAVFVFHGGPGGLPSSPNVELANDVTSSRFGTSVTTAGDVNYDYMWDVIVGAPGFANGQANEGAVYVFHGNFPAITPVPTLTIEGNEVDAKAGQSVSCAGDVNGDKYADVIYGLPGSSPGAVPAAGKAIVLKGSLTGIDAVTPLATLLGNSDSLAVGAGVSLAGDVDADGYADIIVGRTGASTNGPRRGEVHVHRGQAAGVDPSPLFVIGGQADYHRIGASVATAGDMDGDGYADFTIGNPLSTGGAGYAQVFYGGRPGTTYGEFLFGNQAGSSMGASVATSGDFDGDGMAELLVGAPDWSGVGLAKEGAVFAFVGRPGRPTPFVSQPIIGPDNGTSFGESIAILSNADGGLLNGIVIGEPGYDTPAPNAGRIRYHRGKENGFTLGSVQTINGALADGGLGYPVEDAGDVNRDGHSDFVAGSPSYTSDGLTGRGRALLFYGGNSFTQGPWIVEGDQAECLFGAGIGARGDVNGDGYADVVVGASSWDGPGLNHAGKAWLYLGGPGGLSNTAAWSKAGTVENENFGYRIALVDFDADGYSDAAITSQSNSPLAPRVDLFFGGPGGLSANAAFSIAPSPPSASFGTAIANVGDWNSDGIADIVVGAPDDAGGTLHFYPGSRARSAPTVAGIRKYTGIAGASQLGYSLAGGYDLDGDGRSDFVAGAPSTTSPESNEGRVYVFRGRTGPGPMLPDTTLELNVPNLQLGLAVTMGDLTGDGYADIAASAPGGAGGNGHVHGWFGGGEGTYQVMNQNEPCCGGIYRVSPTRMDSTTKAGFSMGIRSAIGRARLFTRLEIRPQGEPFTNTSNAQDVSFAVLDNGAPGQYGSWTSYTTYVNQLFPNVAYHWRGRTITRSPYFPHGRWLMPQSRAAADKDFGTGGTTTGVGDGDVAAGVRLARPMPNPSNGTVALAFETPARVPVRLDVYDLRGRHVRTLADGPSESGRVTRTWDGTDSHGVRVPPGLYFVELRAGDKSDRTRLVRLE